MLVYQCQKVLYLRDIAAVDLFQRLHFLGIAANCCPGAKYCLLKISHVLDVGNDAELLARLQNAVEDFAFALLV